MRKGQHLNQGTLRAGALRQRNEMRRYYEFQRNSIKSQSKSRSKSRSRSRSKSNQIDYIDLVSSLIKFIRNLD